jgi:hypothetical protein
MYLRSRLKELVSENAELKSSLVESSRNETVRGAIMTLEQNKNKVRKGIGENSPSLALQHGLKLHRVNEFFQSR